MEPGTPAGTGIELVPRGIQDGSQGPRGRYSRSAGLCPGPGEDMLAFCLNSTPQLPGNSQVCSSPQLPGKSQVGWPTIKGAACPLLPLLLLPLSSGFLALLIPISPHSLAAPHPHVFMAGLYFSTLSFSWSFSPSTTLFTPLPMP